MNNVVYLCSLCYLHITSFGDIGGRVEVAKSSRTLGALAFISQIIFYLLYHLGQMAEYFCTSL